MSSTDTPTLPDSLPQMAPPEDDRIQEDYFGTDETFKCILPDGKSWVETRAFTEGLRRSYLSKTNRDVRMSRATQDMHFALPGGEERQALLEIAIVNWNLVRRNKNGDPVNVTFNKDELRAFLTQAKPSVIDHIEKHVRRHERWLLTEVTSADIRKQISDLEEQLEQKLEEERGNDSSNDK